MCSIALVILCILMMQRAPVSSVLIHVQLATSIAQIHLLFSVLVVIRGICIQGMALAHMYVQQVHSPIF